MINKLPKQIYEVKKNLQYNIDDIGRSEDQVIIFENQYVLLKKIINIII